MKNVMMVGVVLREVALLWFVVGIAGKFEEEEIVNVIYTM